MADDVTFKIGVDLKKALIEAQKLESSIDSNTLSMKTLRQSYTALNQAIDPLALGSKEWKEQAANIAIVENELENLIEKQKQYASSVTLSNSAIDKSGKIQKANTGLARELGFVIQDGAFAFQDIRIAALGVSNNLPRLGEELRRQVVLTGSYTGALKALGSSLFSFTGIVSLIPAALLAYTAFSTQAKKETEELKEEVNELEQAFNKLLKVKDPLANIGFDVSLKEIPALIQSVKDEIESLDLSEVGARTQGLDVPGGEIGGVFDKAQLEAELGLIKLEKEELEAFLQTLEKIDAGNRSRQRAFDRLGRSGLEEERGIIEGLRLEIEKLTDLRDSAKSLEEISRFQTQINAKQEELNKLIKEQVPSNKLLDLYKDTLEEQQKILRNSRLINEAGTDTRPELSTVTVPATGLPDIPQITEQEIREAFPIQTTIVDAFETTIRSAGIGTFEVIFGEANSFFEQFLANIVDGFAGIAAQDIAGGLLNIITNGAAGEASGILDFIGEALSKSSSQIVDSSQNIAPSFNQKLRIEIPLVVDGKETSRAVVEPNLNDMLGRLSGRRVL